MIIAAVGLILFSELHHITKKQTPKKDVFWAGMLFAETAFPEMSLGHRKFSANHRLEQVVKALNFFSNRH